MTNPEITVELEVPRGDQGLIPDAEDQPPGIIDLILKTGDLVLIPETGGPDQNLKADVQGGLHPDIAMTLILQMPNVTNIHIHLIQEGDINHSK